jgi:hypothetical protein
VLATWTLTTTEFTLAPCLYCLRHLLTLLPIALRPRLEK